MNPNNLVCRTCLGIISSGKVAHNIDDENGLIRNVRNIREMITFCVPEMDIYISVSPVVCESCLSLLVSVYNFKIRCLRVENAIHSYVRTNNVMEGSCVNLNNVVKQQIVEALKQKNWPVQLINEYVDKHLCISKAAAGSPSVELFHAMANKFNAPRMPSNANPRRSGTKTLDSQLIASNNGLPAPLEGIQAANVRSPPPPGGGYITVSKNLMPSVPKPLVPTDSLRLNNPVFGAGGPPLVANTSGALDSPPPQDTESLPTSMGDFQNAFLNALQLTANGGREEAVFVKKPEKTKRAPRKSKDAHPIQNYIPPAIRKRGSPWEISPNVNGGLSNPNPKSMNQSLSSLLTSTKKPRRERQAVVKETNLRSVRKSGNILGTGSNNGTTDDDVIILDDDTEVETPRVGDELLLMNFEENDSDVVLAGGNVQSTNKTAKDTSEPAKGTIEPVKTATEFAKTIFVKLPMIDKETLKRKLTPEDVIEEIQSKRRKLVVRLSSSLPYLHKNKRIVVNVRRNQFFTCLFCRFITIEQNTLQKHYLDNHKVCALCDYKCHRPSVLTQHINMKHLGDLLEALKKCEENKSELRCHLCNFTGLSDFDLRDHRMRIHVKCDITGMYKCPFANCTKEHAMATNILNHIERAHDKLRQTQCPLCLYVAQSPYLLKKHIHSHSWLKIKCRLCLFFCKTFFSLKMHMNQKHQENADESTIGLVDVDQDISYNDDYRVTLDTLQPRSTESLETPQNKSVNVGEDSRCLDEYEFALPSLSEMLCAQAITEDPSDQEDDCTVVSVGEPKKKRKTRRRIGPAKKKSATVKKKGKNRKEVAVDDPEDCMIVAQEIPTVDLSDDEDAAPNESKKKKLGQDGLEDANRSFDVIEIDDHNDSEDCFVVSEDVAIETEATPRQSADAGTSTSLPGDSETDTCSEMSVGAKTTSPQCAVSGSETETCSEVSAGNVLRQQTQTENVEDVVGQENEITPRSDDPDSESVESQLIASQDDTVSELQNDASNEKIANEENLRSEKNAEEETLTSENEVDANKEETAETNSDKNKPDLSENTNQDSSSNHPENSKDETLNDGQEADQNVEDKEKTEESRQTAGLTDDESLSSKSSESKNPSESHDLIVPANIYSESVVIESSDEDSNDCAFVSETSAPKVADRDSIEAENIDNQDNLEMGKKDSSSEKDSSSKKDASSEKDVSEVSGSSSDEDNLKESQKELEECIGVKETNDIAPSEKASEEKTSKDTEYSVEKDIGESTDIVATESIPGLDDTIVSSEFNKPAGSELQHTDLDVEINKEKDKESIVLQSGIQSESVEITEESSGDTSDTEKNVSDNLNTDSETEDTEHSESSRKSSNVVDVSKVLRTAEEIKNNENVKTVMETNNVEIAAVESEDIDGSNAESAQDVSKAKSVPNMEERETLKDMEIVEEEKKDVETTVEKNIVENSILESEDVESTSTECDQNVSNAESGQDVEHDISETKEVDSQIRTNEKSEQNDNKDTALDTLESIQKNLLSILAATDNIVQESCTNEEVQHGDKCINVNDEALAEIAHPDSSIPENVSDSTQNILIDEREDDKGIELHDDALEREFSDPIADTFKDVSESTSEGVESQKNMNIEET